ncbi:transposase [Streptomyces nigrescens]
MDRIAPLMPTGPRQAAGRPPPSRRGAIARKYCTYSPWLGVPDELGSFQTAHKWLISWIIDGAWERNLTAFLARSGR